MIPTKICGITRAEDARLAASLGASAIGFVFWPQSPRFVDPQDAREIVCELPPFLPAVGVFVNQPASYVRHVAELVRLEAVQLHGDERPEDYADLPYRVIKSVGIGGPADAVAAEAVPPGTTVLLDARDPGDRGGTGRAIDWTVAAAIAARRRVILSGGLHAGNVAAAIAAVSPYAIDLSSGVESSPGRKDPEKLRALFAALERV
ncbi:MAG TPA: phosphoribosylanthranilate isomerase [Vicinamibacterales bacterium]|nr:phosphoribosylanthranilate isomerase [Vicinamibacterales bacterium]